MKERKEIDRYIMWKWFNTIVEELVLSESQNIGY